MKTMVAVSDCIDMVFTADRADAVDNHPISLPGFALAANCIFSWVGSDSPQILVGDGDGLLFLLEHFIIEPEDSKLICEPCQEQREEQQSQYKT